MTTGPWDTKDDSRGVATHLTSSLKCNAGSDPVALVYLASAYHSSMSCSPVSCPSRQRSTSAPTRRPRARAYEDSHRHLNRQTAHIRHLSRQHLGSKRARSSEKRQVTALSYTDGRACAVLYTEEVGGSNPSPPTNRALLRLRELLAALGAELRTLGLGAAVRTDELSARLDAHMPRGWERPAPGVERAPRVPVQCAMC